MIPAPVGYVRPDSLEEALGALEEPEAKALAGGQSLLPAMKLRLARPTLLVDLAGLGLRGVRADDGEVAIGALTTWDDLVRSDALHRPELAALSECAAGIGDLQVRNLGTIGGGLAHADPASDMPAVALALGARVRLRGGSDERTLDVAELFLGPFTTGLEPGELITEVVVPVPQPGSGSAYVSVEHPASGFALAGAAALAGPGGTTRVAVTGIAGRPFFLEPEGEPEEALAQTGVTDDRFAPAEYRRHLAAVVVRRARALARERAEEGVRGGSRRGRGA
jgi:carbon-monoxide dehydrogenase medium subunit